MSQGLRGYFENEQHWLLLACLGEEHVVILQRRGPLFVDHPLECAGVAAEGALLSSHAGGCYLLAGWWAAQRELWSVRVRKESEGLLRLSLDTLLWHNALQLVGTPSAVFFLVKLIRQRSPTTSFQFEGF